MHRASSASRIGVFTDDQDYVTFWNLQSIHLCSWISEKVPMKHLRRMLHKVLLAVLTLSALAHLRADAVDDYIKAAMKALRIPGLSLAVVKDGHLVKAAGYGLSNVETATPATPETTYKVASISKPIIATAVMLLAQQNKLSLNDTVARYLADSPRSGANVTINHLLSHTSGLVRDPPDYHPYVEQQPMAVIESAYSLPLQSKPGERWSYSNIGYYVLAEIITRAAGTPWSDFIAKQLFEPAGMTSTRLTSVWTIIPNRSVERRRLDRSKTQWRLCIHCLGSGEAGCVPRQP